MSQKARPASDVSTGGWTPTPLYAEVNEVTPSDATYVTAPVGGGTFVVKLAPIAPPASDTGQPAPTLTVRLNGPASVLVQLLQGSTVIAARVYTPGSGFSAHVMTLTAAEAAQIVYPQDPTQDPDLRVRVTDQVSSGGYASCCPLSFRPTPLNAILYATVTGEGVSGPVTLTWNGTNWSSGAVELDCGGDLYLRFSTDCWLEYSCNGSVWAAAGGDNIAIGCGPPFGMSGFVLDMPGSGLGCNVLCTDPLSVSVSE